MAEFEERDYNVEGEELINGMIIVVESMLNQTINMSWVLDFDYDLLHTYYLAAAQHNVKANESLDQYPTHEDAVMSSFGIARTLDALFNLVREHSEGAREMTQFVVFSSLARRAYENGVRDAHEHLLSDECMRRIAKRIDESDEKARALEAFHRELKDL